MAYKKLKEKADRKENWEIYKTKKLFFKRWLQVIKVSQATSSYSEWATIKGEEWVGVFNVSLLLQQSDLECDPPKNSTLFEERRTIKIK